MAFVVGRAIKQVENEFFTSEGQIKNEKVRNQEFFYKISWMKINKNR